MVPICRFVLYLGSEICVGSLVTEPVNSIIHQSFHSHEREEPLNGDGFGLAWYPTGGCGGPAVFRDITPAWNNLNLLNLARVISSTCILAHVRAATPGLPVIQLNCHPFVSGHFSFMHNGRIGGFHRIRRALMAGLSDRAYDSIGGSTDSEYLFALFLDTYRALEGKVSDPEEHMYRALGRAVLEVERLKEEAGETEPSLLNLALTDGRRAVVSRYVSRGGGRANSLYFHAGGSCECTRQRLHIVRDGGPRRAVIVASEPLTTEDEWTEVPTGNMLVVGEDLHMEFVPF